MSYISNRELISGVVFGACIAGTMALIVTGFALKLKQGEEPEPEPVVEEYVEHVPLDATFRCTHSSMTLYNVENVSDFNVFPGESAGWLWTLTLDNGQLVFFQQPPRVFCSIIIEE